MLAFKKMVRISKKSKRAGSLFYKAMFLLAYVAQKKKERTFLPFFKKCATTQGAPPHWRIFSDK